MNKELKFYITGDCHGIFSRFFNLKNKINLNQTAFICLGDFGINYYLNHTEKKTKRKLNELGCLFYILRGNHEERPSKLPDIKKIFDENVEGYVLYEENYPNIRYFLDEGDIYCIGGKTCLILPGAYSIDKNYRLEHGLKWFESEQLDDNEMEKLLSKINNINNFSYIFSHTAPLSWEQYFNDLFLKGINQEKIDKNTELFLQRIYKNITYKRWYFGHFHDDRNIDIENAIMLNYLIIPFGEKINPMKESFNE